MNKPFPIIALQATAETVENLLRYQMETVTLNGVWSEIDHPVLEGFRWLSPSEWWILADQYFSMQSCRFAMARLSFWAILLGSPSSWAVFAWSWTKMC